MANWNSNDGFRNQRKRSFIYKSAGQNKVVGNAVKADPNLTSTSSSSRVDSSPRKKIKSSYGFNEKTPSRQEASEVEELCSDLPANAFDDDLADEDDLLCEAAFVAEMEQEMAAKKKNFKEIRTTDQHLGEDDFDNLAVGNDVLEEAARKLNNNTSHATETITSETNHVETNLDTSAHETTALLFSSPSCSTNTLRNNNGIMPRYSKGGSRTHVSNGCANENDRSEESHLLKSKLQELNEKVRKLEEDKFLMDGQLKTMSDTLVHYQEAEAKQKEKLKMIEEEKRKTVDEKEKELKKQIEQLTTQLYFKDQEITQAKEQVKKQVQVPNECSPHRKKHLKLTDHSFIPTGQSFFEKKPVDVQLSPKNKAVKLQKSPVKSKPEVVRSVLEGLSSAGKVSSDSRELEKRSVKEEKKFWDGSANELLQKLLKLENIRVRNLSPEFEICGVNQSLLLLLNSSSRGCPVEGPAEGAEVQKLVKQQTHTPKKGIELELDMESKDSGLRQSVYDNIQDLLNVQPTNFNNKCKEQLNLVSNCMATNIFDSHQKAPSVQGFLKLFEYRISQYIDLRLENDEESLSSTCSPGSPGEAGEMRQLVDKDGSFSLLEALDAAVQSLRCLNILILHSHDVCKMLLRSSKVFSSKENEVEELTVANNGIEQQSSNSKEEKSDLLNLVLKLAVPLQNEPSLVTQVALCVISSLAQCCPTEYRNRFLPLLCDTLLPQCISRDSSPTVISLLVPILRATAAIPHLMKHLCSQSDECLLLKVYQCCLIDADDSSNQIMFEVMALIETILSSKTEAIPLLLDSECHCSLELLKYLVLLLHKKMVYLQHFLSDTLKLNKDIRENFLLLRRGMFLLANLLTNSSRLLADLRVEVERQYVNLIIGTTQLYSTIKDMPDGEGMLLQDLLDFEHIEDDEILQQDYDEDGVEDMEIDT